MPYAAGDSASIIEYSAWLAPSDYICGVVAGVRVQEIGKGSPERVKALNDLFTTFQNQIKRFCLDARPYFV